MTSDRAALRLQLRQRRQALTEQQQQDAAKQALQSFQSLLVKSPHSPKRVALYLSNDGELSPEYIVNWCWEQNISLYLPILDGQALLFGRYTPNCEWKANRFAIPEPVDTAPLTGAHMDWVLLPLVGFDVNGGRMGMGGGFYDRTFEHIERDKTRLIGLAHDCQEVDQLPVASWDVPLSTILTPTRLVEID